MTAPRAPGVFGLYHSTWVYVGESKDICETLLKHLNQHDSCVEQQAPTSFAFERVDAPQARLVRWNQLILELQPVCNQRPA